MATTHQHFHLELRHATAPTYFISYLFPALLFVYELLRVDNGSAITGCNSPRSSRWVTVFADAAVRRTADRRRGDLPARHRNASRQSRLRAPAAERGPRDRPLDRRARDRPRDPARVLTAGGHLPAGGSSAQASASRRNVVTAASTSPVRSRCGMCPHWPNNRYDDGPRRARRSASDARRTHIRRLRRESRASRIARAASRRRDSSREKPATATCRPTRAAPIRPCRRDSARAGRAGPVRRTAARVADAGQRAILDECLRGDRHERAATIRMRGCTPTAIPPPTLCPSATNASTPSCSSSAANA